MKLLLLMTLLCCQFSYGQSIFAPFREGQSNYLTPKQIKKALKQFNNSDAFKKALENHLVQVSDGGEQTLLNLGLAIQKSYEGLPDQKQNFNYNYENVLIFMRTNELIDDVLFRLLKDHFEQYFFMERPDESIQKRPVGPALELKDYINKKEAIKKGFLKLSKNKDEVVTNSQLNPFPVKQFGFRIGDHRNLSARERLYYLYSPTQIREMGMIMDLALNIADAKNVYTTIEFRNGSAPMVINHSPTEQYRLALRVMRSQKDEAENDRGRIGATVSDIDLISSAYELGILSYDEVSLVANNKDFYLPEVSFAKKVMNYLGNLASIAIRVHPVTAPYAIIPMMLYNSYTELKKSQSKVDEESFIFSLPKRN